MPTTTAVKQNQERACKATGRNLRSPSVMYASVRFSKKSFGRAEQGMRKYQGLLSAMRYEEPRVDIPLYDEFGNCI
jgi:hypothetical protein